MKIAIVAESFLPSINGVTHSVLHVVENLLAAGHHVDVVAAAPPGRLDPSVLTRCRAAVHWVPSLAVPGYRSLRWAAPGVSRLQSLLSELEADIVHLAAPFVLGWDAVRAARALELPTVAVFQTDLPSYAARYGLAALEPMLWNRVRDVHLAADRTLVPSAASAAQLRSRGIPEVHRWARGVDAASFHPDRRNDGLRRSWSSPGEVVVGYVGRLAAEKQAEDLRAVQDLPGTQLVIIGDGPLRGRLERLLPKARFCGWQSGADLARAVASLDIAVHPGEYETFGQTIQEAMASAVPVVAVARGGPLDLVEPGRTGLLYPARQLDQLRAQVARLVASPDERRRLGRSARELVRGRSWAATTALLLEHYRDVDAQHRSLLVA